jgi:hypothetical protein
VCARPDRVEALQESGPAAPTEPSVPAQACWVLSREGGGGRRDGLHSRVAINLGNRPATQTTPLENGT